MEENSACPLTPLLLDASSQLKAGLQLTPPQAEGCTGCSGAQCHLGARRVAGEETWKDSDPLEGGGAIGPGVLPGQPHCLGLRRDVLLWQVAASSSSSGNSNPGSLWFGGGSGMWPLAARHCFLLRGGPFCSPTRGPTSAKATVQRPDKGPKDLYPWSSLENRGLSSQPHNSFSG